MEEDLPVSIPIRCISEHFACSICMETISHTAMTPCGHRFCRQCIEETVDRMARCPCCNAETRADDLIRDHQLDEFLSNVKAEKEKAVAQLMDKIFARSSSEVVEEEKNLSPFEIVLRKHLRKSLCAHETYLQGMKEMCQRSCSRLHNEAERRMDDVRKKAAGATSDELALRLEAVTRQCDKEQRELKQKLEDVTSLLAVSFDKYLEENLPDPSILPVTISLSVPSKDFKIENFKLSPSDGFEDLLKQLCEQLSKAGQPVARIEPGYKLLLFGPFSGMAGGGDETPVNGGDQAAATSLAGGSDDDNGGIVLAPNCRPLLQHSVKPNSEIQLHGTIVFESDLPKQCFATTFKKGAGEVVDYFTCRDCAFNWVCRNCAYSCHQGHQIQPYIIGHSPTWACCYCPKKKKCTLPTAT